MPSPPPYSALPSRDSAGHKGTYGTALLIGGSRGMSGAAALAGLAALRGGCGLTFVACPVSVQAIVAGFDPSFLTIGLPETEAGQIAAAALPVLAEKSTAATAVGLGPGLGQSAELDHLVTELYRTIAAPLVVDADALNALSRLPEWTPTAGPRILTPHPGEMARLTGLSTAEVQDNRETLAREFAAQKDCIVVLKGEGTVVSDGHDVYFNTTGNNGLATGGTGDVLTGLLTSLLAQQVAPFAAAQLAVYVHGRAADLAVGKWGRRGLIASDLPAYVALALQELE